MNDLISIIVPIYNSERFLDKCLQSLRMQTYSNIEILMIDDGSADGSATICRRYAEGDQRFRYVYQENAGVSAARNNGLALAKGNYIGFCDSDDFVDHDMYELLYKLANQHCADISILSFAFMHDWGTEPFEDQDEIMLFDPEHAIIEMHNCGRFEGHLCNKLFKKSLFDDVKLRSDITILEDMVAVWELFQKADRIVFQDVHKYHYYRNDASATKCAFKESYWTVQTACRLMVENMARHYPQNLAYAQKSAVMHNYSIARKIYQSNGSISRADYWKIKQEIQHNYNKNVEKLIDRKCNFEYKCFLKGKLLFCLFESALRIKNRLKGKKDIR